MVETVRFDSKTFEYNICEMKIHQQIGRNVFEMILLGKVLTLFRYGSLAQHYM